MNQKIKTIFRRILRVFAGILFLASIFFSFAILFYFIKYGIEVRPMGDWITFIISLGLMIGLGYVFRNALLIPYYAFSHLNRW